MSSEPSATRNGNASPAAILEVRSVDKTYLVYRRPIDRLLLFFALMLMVVGMVWIYSASAIKASQNNAAATAFLVKQMVGGFIGLSLMLALTINM